MNDKEQKRQNLKAEMSAQHEGDRIKNKEKKNARMEKAIQTLP